MQTLRVMNAYDVDLTARAPEITAPKQLMS